MPKKIKFESFKYRFLIAAQNAAYRPVDANQTQWDKFVKGLEFSYEKGAAGMAWQLPNPSGMIVQLDEARFYLRGDNEKDAARQREAGLMDSEDPIKLKNDIFLPIIFCLHPNY